MRAPKLDKAISHELQEINIDQCLAKTWKQSDNAIIAGRTVHSHCLIVGLVANNLLHRYPKWLTDLFFPAGSNLIAACHDIGKISPSFQRKLYAKVNQPPNEIWQLIKDNQFYKTETAWGGHAGVSQVTLSKLVTDEYIPGIAGRHHGFRPNIGGKKDDAEVFGGKEWLIARQELVKYLTQKLETNFPQVKSVIQAKLLSGLTTVSDWIGSGSLFENPEENYSDLIDQAVDNAGFIPPKFRINLTFNQIFKFEPNAIQQQFTSMIDKPGVYILEAPMGIGKTEAALYAAYKMVASNQAIGIYFALPTQLTSNKIHERMQDFLDNIVLPNSLHTKALLLHSNAKFDTEMGEDANPGEAWFNQSKRGLLAPFAVGTIDQALMAVLNVKHGFIRSFGLVGKVVILDEVHTYDSYTGMVLEQLIAELRELHCTVIILSATLTQASREKFLGTEVNNRAYPLISGIYSQSKQLIELFVPVLTTRKIKITTMEDEVNALNEALYRANSGQQVLWIENTVSDAQLIFDRLAARANGIEVGLLHSKYTKYDRNQIEQKWVKLYGKNNSQQRNQCGRILVGTQILEQSLDIDADFLVTQIAPTDMLLQRLGRLWRHENFKRNESACCEAWIIAPDLTQAISQPDKYFKATAKVYAPYVLCRSLEVIKRVKIINLPNDIRELIESSYQERNETGNMQEFLAELNLEREKLRRFALINLSTLDKPYSDEVVLTRYSEQKMVEVLLVQNIVPNYNHDGKIGVKLIQLNGTQVFLTNMVKSVRNKEWRFMARQLMDNVVKVAEHKAPQAIRQTEISWLKDYMYLGIDDLSLVRVALVNKENIITTLDHNPRTNAKYQLSYTKHQGYMARKN